MHILKVNNNGTEMTWEVCSSLGLKKPTDFVRRYLFKLGKYFSGIFIFDFEQIFLDRELTSH